MKILAIDPGKTTGYVVLDASYALSGKRPTVARCWEGKATLRERAGLLARWLLKYHIQRVVVEDFKIHPTSTRYPVATSMTDTIEFIGCIEAVCQLANPRVEVYRVQPNKKGRWSKARLNAKYPNHALVTGVHAHDALVIGLVHLESAGLWEV